MHTHRPLRSSWRHWGCVTAKIITNMKNSFNDADELDGFDDLQDDDQDRVKKAWEDGRVAGDDAFRLWRCVSASTPRDGQCA